MLKTIVENVQTGGKFPLGDYSGRMAAFADNDGNPQAARDQQRLVAEVGRVAIPLDHQHAASSAAISAGEHVERNAARM